MQNNLLIELEKQPVIKLKAKNTWLPGYDIVFDFRANTYANGIKNGEIPMEHKAEFYKILANIEYIPEPTEPTRKVKIDCTYELDLFGRKLIYTNYTFQINRQLTDFQRALLKLADGCGLKVY